MIANNVIVHKALQLSKNPENDSKNEDSGRMFKEATKKVITKVLTFNDGENNYEETKKYECIYLQYKYNCLLMCIFSLISIISSIINYEASSHNIGEDVELISTLICFASSGLLYMALIFDYIIKSRITALVTKLPIRFIQTKMSKLRLALMIAIFFFHPFPFTRQFDIPFYNKKYDMAYTTPLNAFFVMLCFFRMWFFIKYYLVSSIYYEPRTQRICAMNGFNTDLMFAFKGNVNCNPFEIYGLLFTIIFFFFSYGIRIFERELDGKTGLQFANYWNCLWCLIITMTTVGYGDFTPSTEMGQFLVIMSCLSGVMLLSMLIVAITNILNLTGNEKSIYIMLERIDLMNEKDAVASKLVSRYTNLYRKMKNKETINISFEKEMFRFAMHSFKTKCKELHNSFPVYNEMDNIRENLDFLEDDVNLVKGECRELSNMADKIFDRMGNFK
jgi:hypothetical protein